MPSTRFSVLAVLLGMTSFAQAATPETVANVENVKSYAEDTGSAERIESADHLRTYSQEIAAAACFLYNGIDKDISSALMTEARTGFDLHLDALINGNDSLGIKGGEERKKTIVKLEEIKASWRPLAAAADALMADNGNSDAVNVIKSGNMPLFEKTDILVSEMEGQYSNPTELMQVDVLMIEIVSRQAMMTQKIAKNACKIYTGNTSEEIKGALEGSMAIYEASLNALLNGMPEIGIKPAPTEEIAKMLKNVLADWTEMRPLLNKLLEGQSVERDALVYLFEHMVDETHKLEEITHAYVVFSKHEYE